MTCIPLVGVHASAVSCKDVIELRRRRFEYFEVHWIFLVPENRGNFVVSTPCENLYQLLAPFPGLGHRVIPLALVPAPGRFGEKRIGRSLLQFVAPAGPTHENQLQVR